uniref:Uncharacterized protein n=1 Tax=Trichogramma kaykai TaxID=54128 RepID=A0ABD2X880_9HYME
MQIDQYKNSLIYRQARHVTIANIHPPEQTVKLVTLICDFILHAISVNVMACNDSPTPLLPLKRAQRG